MILFHLQVSNNWYALKISGPGQMKMLSLDAYQIVWLANLATDRAAATALLDESHEQPESFRRDPSDINSYTWGRMGNHNILIASAPTSSYGSISTFLVARGIISSLPQIKYGLSVGIGSGTTNSQDIRLGDVVVARPKGGIVQYDWANPISNLKLGPEPPLALQDAVSRLQTRDEITKSMIPKTLQKTWLQYARSRKSTDETSSYIHQGFENDKLFMSSYGHAGGETCDECDSSKQVKRDQRATTDPEIHYGVVLCGNTVVKNATTRDKVATTCGLDAICIETGAFDLMKEIPCIVIRGICDYGDSHGNKRWRRYASATAAAYAKAILLTLVPNQTSPNIGDSTVQTVEDSVIISSQRSTTDAATEPDEIVRIDQNTTDGTLAVDTNPVARKEATYKTPEELEQISQDLNRLIVDWKGLDYSRFGLLKIHGTVGVSNNRTKWQLFQVYLFDCILIFTTEKESNAGTQPHDGATYSKQCVLESCVLKRDLYDVIESSDLEDNILILQTFAPEMTSRFLRFKESMQLNTWKQAFLEVKAAGDPEIMRLIDQLPVADGAMLDYHHTEQPMCLFNTRVETLQVISTWANNPKAKSVLWLTGSSGVGKSTISRTVAQTLDERGLLGATFFFKRYDKDRGNLSKLITTIAAQLGQRYSFLSTGIAKAISYDPAIINRGLREQFSKLILQPVLEASQHIEHHQKIVIVIDGLDECTSYHDIALILTLLSGVKTESLHLKIFVTSHSEFLITTKFIVPSDNSQFLFLDITFLSETERDLYTFFEFNLTKAQEKYDKIVLKEHPIHSDWPSHRHINLLVEYSNRSFLVATEALQSIANQIERSPKDGLKAFLTSIQLMRGIGSWAQEKLVTNYVASTADVMATGIAESYNNSGSLSYTQQTTITSASTADVTATGSAESYINSGSSPYAQQTTIKSISTEDRSKPIELGAVDNESTYTSDVPESTEYMRELVVSLVKGLDYNYPNTEYLDKIHAILPNLLHGFAMRVAGEGQSSDHFEVMKFIHKRRRNIATVFKEYCLKECNDNEISSHQSADNMPLLEKFGRWQVALSVDDPNLASQPLETNLLDDGDSNIDNAGDNYRNHDEPNQSENGDDDNNGSDDEFLSKYGHLVTESTSFKWLCSRLHREIHLTFSEASTMNGIATKIRQKLHSQHQPTPISSKAPPKTYSLVFKSNWKPLVFASEQDYNGEAKDVMEAAIVLVSGNGGELEAMPCSEYLNRTWPLLGELFLSLVKDVVRGNSASQYSVSLFDGTKLISWLDTLGNLVMSASGISDTIVEIGEMYSWMVAAVRAAEGESIATVIPVIEASASPLELTFRVDDYTESLPSSLVSEGQCWKDIFRNPVVVHGFPVARPPPMRQPGLELSLANMAALLGTTHLAVFCGNIILKGFCTMLVPTSFIEGVVYWHALFHADGSRIAFTDSRISKIVSDFNLAKHLTLSAIERARHIVGWCTNVHNYTGSHEANYDIGKSELDSPDTRFVLDRISLSVGKIASLTASGLIIKKDKPLRAAKATDYHKQLEWIEQHFVVLYDLEARRGWLVDGLSAVLHLVRTALAQRRTAGREVLFDENDWIESQSPYQGKVSANNMLLDRRNMNLKIYEIWNRLVEETTEKSSGVVETTIKTLKSWYQLPDLVGDIFTNLHMIIDIQTDTLTEDGFGTRIRKSPRRHLEGWEFVDVATDGKTLWPKMNLLNTTGLGWVDLLRSINAVTLFGTGFGELIQPRTNQSDLCSKWAQLPCGMDMLATTMPLLRDIMEITYKRPTNNNQIWEIFKDIYWHNPDKIFESCNCGADGTIQCDRVQVLLPTQFPNIRARGLRSPNGPLPDNGAVIFGHSWKFPLIWKLEAGSVPVEGQPLESPQLEMSSSHQSDSGLEASILSNENQNPSSQTSNATSSSRLMRVGGSTRRIIGHLKGRLNSTKSSK